MQQETRVKSMPEWLVHLVEGPGDPRFLARALPWSQAMIGCPHDAIYHAEGDPFIHTGMVAQELECGAGFDALSEEKREILRIGAWLHDIAKPATTQIIWDEALQRERVRQPGHAPLGAAWAWQGLLDAGYDPLKARDVHGLVFWHQRPGHLAKSGLEGPIGIENTAVKRVIQFSHETVLLNWDDLLRLCAADSRGRRFPGGIQPGIEDLELARMFIEDQGGNAGVDLIHERWPFANAAARLTYLRSEGKTGNPFYTPKDPSGSRVILLSGLPGSGKNTLLSKSFSGLPSISFDDLRAELRMSQGDNQGRMIQAAFEKAREYLRRGEDFVWNATCLSLRARQKIAGLALDYDAKVEIHAIDIPLETSIERNRGRGDHAIPEGALRQMAQKREPAMPVEAHEVWSYDAELRPQQLFADSFAAPLPVLQL
ncbi:AAA family ATPase [Paracoccus litorisediminis]|uniref:AAA family ATPase n=1 Tax=Paracoccus litorisediminis TaxID=2006130 RepID=UPI00372F374C